MEHKASMPDRVMHVLVDLVVLLIQQSSLKSLNFNLPADFSFLSNPSFQALDKSKYRDGLRAIRRYIPRLEQDLELLKAQAKGKAESGAASVEETLKTEDDVRKSRSISSMQLEKPERLKEIIDRQEECPEDECATDLGMVSDSEDLSDIFETDSETETQDKAKGRLYLDEFERFPIEGNGEAEDLEEQLRQLCKDSKEAESSEKDVSPSLDEFDRMVLRAASLLKRQKR